MKQPRKKQQNKTVSCLIVSFILLSTIGITVMQTMSAADSISSPSFPRFSFDKIVTLLNPLSSSRFLQLNAEKDYNYSEAGYCILQTADGGYIIVGSSSYFDDISHNYTESILVIKTDANGNKQWYKTYDEIEYAMGFSIVENNDNSYLIAGNTDASLLFLKIDNNGNKKWEKTLSVQNGCYGVALKNTSDGGYIITGYSGSPVIVHSDEVDTYILTVTILLVKTDNNGTMQWSHTYRVNENEYNIGAAVQQTSDSGYLIAGDSISFLSHGIVSEGILIKTDSNGMEEWNKTIQIGEYMSLLSLAPTTDNNYLVTGFTSTSESSTSMLLLKIDEEGNEKWNKTIGPENAGGASIQRIKDNGFIIVGYCTPIIFMPTDDIDVFIDVADVCLVKTDAEGNELWNTTFNIGSMDISTFVQETSDNGFVITGYTIPFTHNSLNFFNNQDVLFIKTYGNGTVQWKKTFGWSLPDTEPPRITITKPLPGMHYRQNEIVRSSKQTIILGGITIEANASDNRSLNRVEFYIDGVLKGTDAQAPYTYSWDHETIRLRLNKHRHVIKVIAYDDAGNKATKEIQVLRFF